MAIEEQLTIIREELAGIRATGENTLSECRKTNGRVTKLEDAHNETKLQFAELRGKWGEKFVNLEGGVDELVPKIEKNQSFMDKLTGSWQVIALVGMILFEVIKSLKQ